MNTASKLRDVALLYALALGVLADLLVRVAGRPGLNILLWALAGVGVLLLLLRKRGQPAARETCWLVGGALGFAALLTLRDAGALAVFSLFAAVALLLMAAGRAATAWAVNAQASDVVFAVLRVVVLCAAGPFGWGRGKPETPAASEQVEQGTASFNRGKQGTPTVATSAEHAAATVAARDGTPTPLISDHPPAAFNWPRAAMRGLLMALPALIVLTALLMSADPVFSRMVERSFPTSLDTVIAHLAFAAVIGWLTAGFLRAFMKPDRIFASWRPPSPAFAAAEVSIALWLLNLLFGVFMLVQLRYLFGGADLVQVTPGLSYAEYARRGFFELVFTAVLVIPLLLIADWAAAPDSPRMRQLLHTSMRVLVVLLLGVIGSAAYRMWLYQDAYGLTAPRLYGSVFIVWLTAVFGWLVFTVLRGQRERFAFGSMLAAFVCIALLHLLNPHALIARVNIDRAIAGKQYDSTYLDSLSADAVPTLLARMNQLQSWERCGISNRLATRWAGERRGGWRTWNYSDWRARRLVAPLAGTLACEPAAR